MANPLRAVVHRGVGGDKLSCGHTVPAITYVRRRRCPFCGENKTEAVIAKKLGRRT